MVGQSKQVFGHDDNCVYLIYQLHHNIRQIFLKIIMINSLRQITKVVASSIVVGLCLLGNPVLALDEIEVGYFLDWPTPNLVAKADGAFESEMGLPVNWQAFETGEDMNRALAKGDIQIAYAQEFVSFLKGITDGLDIVMTGIAVSYPEYDFCVVAGDKKITQENVQTLAGKRIAVQVGEVTHFRMQKVLTHLGINADRVELVPVSQGASATRALYYSEAEIACSFGSTARKMLRIGTPLMSGEEQEDIGLKIFDIVAMPRWFLDEHENLAKQFMEITARANVSFQDNPDAMRYKIAQTAGMNQRSANFFLSEFRFLTLDQQSSPDWMGTKGVVETYSKELVDFLESHGVINTSLADFSEFIDIRLLE